MRAVRSDVRDQQQELQHLATTLYEQHAKPLEAAHAGKFVAISKDGRVLLGETASSVGRQARATFGPGNFVFKLGPRVVGKWR